MAKPRGIQEINKEENKDNKTIHARSLNNIYTNEIKKERQFERRNYQREFAVYEP